MNKPETPTMPMTKLYNFVREHLIPMNNIIVASATLFTVLDFLVPRTEALSRIVYSGTTCLVALMVAAAFAPRAVDKMLSALGYQASRRDATPLWKHPTWILIVVLMLLVSLIGFASIAKASQGGLIASEIPSLRSLQENALALQRDVGKIKIGVDQANGKLDTLLANSKDPQKDLVARGYAFSTGGLTQAIHHGDQNAVALFIQTGLRVDGEATLSVLMHGEPWSQDVANLLPQAMFQNMDSCRTGFYMYAVKEPVEARLKTYKRLCDPTTAIDNLEKAIKKEEQNPTPGDYNAKRRIAMSRNLAALKG